MTNHSNKKQVILGTVRKMNISQVRPFLDSLRETGYEGDCVFFCTEISKELEVYLKSRGVIIIPFFYFAIRNHQPLLLFWPLWKKLISMLPTFGAKAWIAKKVWFLFYLRFLLYYEFLLNDLTPEMGHIKSVVTALG
jgi:predicted RND superfamily exporter protein